MAKKLEDLLQPGEQVIFRARYSALELTRDTLILIAFLSIFSAAFHWNNPEGFDFLANSFLVFFIPAWLAGQMWNAAALLTDQRLLYRHGAFRPNIEAWPNADIRHIDFKLGYLGYSGVVSIERRFGSKTTLGFIPRPEALQRAIAAQCGLSQPPAIHKAVRIGYGLLNGVGVASALGALVALAWIGFQYLSVGADGRSIETLLIVLLTGPVLLPLSMLIAATPATMICLIGIRVFLTPDQARQIACMEHRAREHGWFAAWNRWCARQMARFLSWLYGQDIRCG